MAVGAESWEEIWFWEPMAKAYYAGFSSMIKVADPEMKAIDAYGLGDITRGDDVARPAAFIIDGDGVIQWRHLPTTWRARPAGPDYLEALREVLGREETE